MEQRLVHDLSQRATRDYVAPCHLWGESFPGPKLKPLRQLTLHELRPPPPSNVQKSKGVGKKERRRERRHRERALLFGEEGV